MSLDRLALILFCVVVFGGGALWLAAVILISATLHPLLSLIPLCLAGLVAYFTIRIVRERVQNPDEDHYDGMEH